MLTGRKKGLALIVGPLIGFGLGLAAHFGLRVYRIEVPPLYAAAFGAMTCAAFVLITRMVSEIHLPRGTDYGARPMSQALESGQAPFELWLTYAVRESRTFATVVRPRLYAVTLDRLRLHYSIDLDRAMFEGPDEVRQIIGDVPWRLLSTTDQSGSAPTLRELLDLVTVIEEL